jgi:P4 family phage/plasmid primase-like protien
MVESWAGEQELPRGRHPWLMGQATRLAAFHRAGLVTAEQYQEAADALVRRFHELLDTWGQPRAAAPGEVALAFGWGQQQASSKTDAALASEFGGHRHEIDGGAFGEGSSCVKGAVANRAELVGAKAVETVAEPLAVVSVVDSVADSVADSDSGSVVEHDGSTEAGEAAVYQMQPQEMFTDARMAELAVRDVLVGRFMWVGGLGWHHWDGKRWKLCMDQRVIEAIRAWAVEQLKIMVVKKRRGPGDPYYDGWAKMLGVPKLKNVVTFAMGIVEREVGDLDGDPDIINTPSGILHLRTLKVEPHDPSKLCTKITSGNYVAGYTHPDWEKALEALGIPDGGATIAWFQARVGQGITGHRSPDGVNVVLQGGGQNGKGVLVSDGLVPAFGDYAELASHKLILGENEHSTEQASLHGKRFLVAEELTEGRALNVGAIKRISDVSTITARHVYQRNMTFRATHTLFATTNYIPVVNETDWGTWRRLALLMFPFTFVATRAEAIRDNDRIGDSRLKGRIEGNETGQHDAAVTWAVEGAARWYQRGADALVAPAWVVERTEAWRGNADRVSAFWADHIVPESESCVLATELFEAFNTWLQENGHKPWSREMFESRFGSHQITLKHGLEKRRERSPKRVSRYVRSADWKPVALDAQAQHQVWLGVRFATSEDRRPLHAVGLLPKIP